MDLSNLAKIRLTIFYNIYNVSNPQRTLFSLSAKNGGLGIPNPAVKASEQFEMSKKTSSLISDSIVNGTALERTQNSRSQQQTNFSAGK